MAVPGPGRRICDVAPGADSVPLGPSSKCGQLLYITSTPTLCLRKLRAGFEHIDPNITSVDDFMQKQAEVNALLVDSMVDVSWNYAAPHLSKKLMYEWVKFSRFATRADP